eukprot:snap_masked-scaffold_4-processed-gene-17.44-mRNA-1 protein AED:1.00 eAED:1.00 QI:0/0/0/0/1/1/3/0/77
MTKKLPFTYAIEVFLSLETNIVKDALAELKKPDQSEKNKLYRLKRREKTKMVANVVSTNETYLPEIGNRIEEAVQKN